MKNKSFLLFLVLVIFLSPLFENDYLLLLFCLFVSLSSYKKFLLWIFLISYFIQKEFVNFFAKEIDKFDIYLFFRHLNETFESFFEFFMINYFDFFYFIIAIFLSIYISKHQKEFINKKIFLIPIVALLPFNHPSFSFLYTLGDFLLFLPNKISSKQNLQKDLNIKYNKFDINVVLIFGESLRYDKLFLFGYHENTTPFLNKLKNEKNFIYSKTISLATCTDVVLPLFLNSSFKQSDINLNNSLFKLAKKKITTTSY